MDTYTYSYKYTWIYTRMHACTEKKIKKMCLFKENTVK